jgi:predicted small secreted protein
VCCRCSLRLRVVFCPLLRASFRKEAVIYIKLVAAVLALAVMAGCNIMAGAGKDVQKAGESLENSAEKHK